MSTIRSADGTQISFDCQGHGRPVILVGGALQYRAIDAPTSQLADSLAEDFSVVSYDRRGRGDSGDGASYSIEREIADIAALIGAIGGSAALFGNSSGAILALDAAAAGVPVTRLALYEAPVIVDASRAPVPDDCLARLQGLVAAGRRGDAVALFMNEVIGVPAPYVEAMRGEPFWPTFEAVAHTLPYDLAIMAGTQRGTPVPSGRWAGVTEPTLVIDGGASEAWVGAGAQALVALLPDARRISLPGQTHAVAPDVLAPVLSDFFAA